MIIVYLLVLFALKNAIQIKNTDFLFFFLQKTCQYKKKMYLCIAFEKLAFGV